jgi:uncharacterized phiE125 gp8 family phage protein
MWNNLARVTGPAVPAVTLEEIKLHLKIDTNEQDAEVMAWLMAATALIDGPRGIGIAMINQSWRLSLDAFPASGIEIRLRPVTAITSIVYTDEAGATQTLSALSYTADFDSFPVIIRPGHGEAWPTTYSKPGAVKVTFSAGHGAGAATVPEPLKAAIKLLVGHYNNNREAVGADFSELPLGVQSILDAYRSHSF